MLSSLVLLAVLGTTPETSERPSFLFQMDTGPNFKIQLRAERYIAQPGDIVLFDDHHRLITKLYKCCGTSFPLHAGIVFRRPDQTMAIVEAGPDAVQKVFIFDLDERLRTYDGTVLIRSPKQPLSAERSQQLTEFCLAQEGKKYALGRLILQGTPFRPHGTLRSQLFGRTVVDRERWMCSELVVAAAAVAGIFDVKAFPANAMYPRDLCYDENQDLSPYYGPPALWYPREVLEFVGSGVRMTAGREK